MFNSFSFVIFLQAYIEQIFNGYLQLMVNSRCEIALSRVINVPDRGLDHQAFTDLRHAAKQTGLSLFQVNCELNFCELECSDSVYLSRTQRDVHI